MPNVERTCIVCNNLFVRRLYDVNRYGGNFCSMKCFYSSGKKHKKSLVEKECLQCKKMFQPIASRQKYCSNHCVNQHNRKAHTPNPIRKAKRGVRESVVYSEWRTFIFERDNYTCQKCNDSQGRNLNAHHIIPFSKDESLRFEPSNGITLCSNCHKKEHKRLKSLLKNTQIDFFIV